VRLVHADVGRPPTGIARWIDSGPTKTFGRARRGPGRVDAVMPGSETAEGRRLEGRAPGGATAGVSSRSFVGSSNGGAGSAFSSVVATASPISAPNETLSSARLHQRAPIRASGPTLHARVAGKRTKGIAAATKRARRCGVRIMRGCPGQATLAQCVEGSTLCCPTAFSHCRRRASAPGAAGPHDRSVRAWPIRANAGSWWFRRIAPTF
jgi:hypothetical protein